MPFNYDTVLHAIHPKRNKYIYIHIYEAYTYTYINVERCCGGHNELRNAYAPMIEIRLDQTIFLGGSHYSTVYL